MINKELYRKNHIKLIKLCNYINSLQRELFYLLAVKENEKQMKIVDTRLRFIKSIFPKYPLVEKFLVLKNNKKASVFPKNDCKNLFNQANAMIYEIICFEEILYKK